MTGAVKKASTDNSSYSSEESSTVWNFSFFGNREDFLSIDDTLPPARREEAEKWRDPIGGDEAID